jgi:LGFP repeat
MPEKRRLSVSRALVIAACLTGLDAGVTLASPIDDKYKAEGGPTGLLGEPTGPETTASDGVCHFRHYQHGSIFIDPPFTAAHEVHGLIHQLWANLGFEKSYLGYPMTDEEDAYDGTDAAGHSIARVSKFQGGELIWRRSTNAVSQVKSTDLVVDLPTPVGEPWFILQANAVAPTDSHRKDFAYCWDFDWNNDQPATNGRPFVAGADSKIVWVDEAYYDGETPEPPEGNVVIQRLGPGRYASYLHLGTGSYSKHFGQGAFLSPQGLPWADRPIVKSGQVLAEASDTGTGRGSYHLHYCVTTAPDRKAFGAIESVPVAFQNFSVSPDGGRTWGYIKVGVPRQGWMVRREAPGTGQVTPQVNLAADPLNYGFVSGQISNAGPGNPIAGGELVVTLISQWGEPLLTKTINVTPATVNGPWPYNFTAPDYSAQDKLPPQAGARVAVLYRGRWSTPATLVSGESAISINVRVGETTRANVQVQPTVLH